MPDQVLFTWEEFLDYMCDQQCLDDDEVMAHCEVCNGIVLVGDD